MNAVFPPWPIREFRDTRSGPLCVHLFALQPFLPFPPRALLGRLLESRSWNPVSVTVTFNLFARVTLLAMQGANQPSLAEATAMLTRDVKGSAERESYLPAVLGTDEKGMLLAEPLKWGGSSDFVAFARATALINVPTGVKTIEVGDRINLFRLPGSAP